MAVRLGETDFQADAVPADGDADFREAADVPAVLPVRIYAAPFAFLELRVVQAGPREGRDGGLGRRAKRGGG
jgi:hypothetical protein